MLRAATPESGGCFTARVVLGRVHAVFLADAVQIAVCPRFSQWVDDNKFDLSDHVRRVAVPGSGSDEDLSRWWPTLSRLPQRSIATMAVKCPGSAPSTAGDGLQCGWGAADSADRDPVADRRDRDRASEIHVIIARL